MDVEVAKMSSKGQIVIPMRMRKRLNAREGTLFAVVGTDDGVMLKKVHTPSQEEIWAHLDSIAKEAGALLKKRGMTEKKLIEIAVKARGRHDESRS